MWWGPSSPLSECSPAIGRLIGVQDDQLGAADAAVAVVSWSYWRNRFNLDPAILGKRISREWRAGHRGRGHTA